MQETIQETDNDQKKAYSEAVSSGQYNRSDEASGKYDNVRLCWEDQITRLKIQPHLKKLYKSRKEQNKKFRIIDLGCGSGDGFELLMNINDTISDSEINNNIIKDEELELYMGIDLNEDLLNQNKERWDKSSNKKMLFKQGDLTKGFPADDLDPFDIYFTSYGTLSHLNTNDTIKLLSDIANHAENGALIICDWLGRFSYEWQSIWDNNFNDEMWMKYLISYIYPAEIRDKVNLTSIDLRLLSNNEVTNLIKTTEKESRYKLKTLDIFDRSIFVGRHMDTGDYNKYLTPKRSYINTLLESYKRTDLNKLLINYHPFEHFNEINNQFELFQSKWNHLITQVLNLINNVKIKSLPTDDVIKKEISYLTHIYENRSQYVNDDFRANILEPALFYSLRNIEMNHQLGLGMGHGFVSIIEIIK